MPLYFAYGSNMSKAELASATGRLSSPGRPAVLRGHRRVFNRMSKRRRHWVANLMPEREATTAGVLFVLSEEQLAAVDDKEAVGRGGYERVSVEVTVDGRALRAITYVDRQATGAGGVPHPHYAYLMVAGATEHGSPVPELARMLADAELATSTMHVVGLPASVGSDAAGQSAAWLHPDAMVERGVTPGDSIRVARADAWLELTMREHEGLSPDAIALSASNRARLGVTLGSTIRIETSPVFGWVRLRTALALREDLGSVQVRVPQALADLLGLRTDQLVEVANEDDTRRWRGRWRPTREDSAERQPRAIQVPAGIRSKLSVELRGTVKLRACHGLAPMVSEEPRPLGVLDELLAKLVGSRTIPVVVEIGADSDEASETVRLSKIDLAALGVDKGQRILVCSGASDRAFRVLEDGRGEEGTLRAPSTVRLRAGIQAGDIVSIRRDPRTTFLLHNDRAIASVLASFGVVALFTRDPFGLSLVAAAIVAVVSSLLSLVISFAKIRNQV